MTVWMCSSSARRRLSRSDASSSCYLFISSFPSDNALRQSFGRGWNYPRAAKEHAFFQDPGLNC